MTRFTATVLLCFYLGSVALISAAGARAHFLPHKSRLTARQKVAYFERSVRHERQATAWLSRRLYLVGATREYRWHRAALRWHLQLLKDWRAKLEPSPREFAGECLAWLIDHEGSGWDPTRYNSHGSGAYGLPQALPGSKMASAGSDWKTNPYTQIRWMRGYIEKYGGCEGARAFWIAHGWY